MEVIFKQNRFSLCIIVSALLGVWPEVTRGEARIQLIPQHPEIGGSVILSVTGLTGRIQGLIWFKGPDVVLLYGPPSQIIRRPLFHDKMEAFPNGSLKISNFNRTDEGHYRVIISTYNESVETSVYLKVYVSPQNDDGADNTTGIINGIVIAVLLSIAVGFLVLLVLTCRRRRKRSNYINPTTEAKNVSKSEPHARTVYENADTIHRNIPPTQVIEVDNTEESHYEQLRNQEMAVYSTMTPGHWR